MADPIEEQLKKLNRKTDQIVTLLETLVALAGGELPQPDAETRTPEQVRADARAQVGVVPRGRIRPRYTPSEMQSIHPHERERY